MKEILITSSVLILALLVLRRVFRRVLSRRVQYALWGLVLLRLLVPVSLPAVNFSILTASQPVQQAVAGRFEAMEPVYVPVDRAPIEQHPTAPDLAPAQAMAPTESQVWVVETEDTAVEYRRLSTGQVLSILWKTGMGLIGGWFLLSNLLFYRKLRRCRTLFSIRPGGRKVYLLPERCIPSPCLFGGAIYLTPAAVTDPEKLRHVLAHEETHARHLDPLWSLLRCVCLTVYWFDPLVWAAATCSKTDGELACDEGALARLGEEERIPYGQTLISLIPVKRSGNPLLTATTMTAGKKQLKDRITRIAQNPKQLMAAALAVAVLAGVVSACTFTGAKTSEPPGTSQGPTEAILRPLSGTELEWFNESFFNNGGDYTVRNQFANPINLYDRPEDVDLYDLFYLEGSAPSDEEVRTILDTDPGELPCGAYKFTTAEMDAILKANTGLTLAETNKKELTYTYDEATDAYYWMHGDTNYCGELDFLCGTREGSTVKLYHNSNFSGSSWYCVTLSEQEDGTYWFLSNQKCEHPAIPPVLPSGDPDAAISVMDLTPYTAEAVEVEAHPNHYSFNYETCYDNWSINDHSIMVYRADDGVVYAAYVVDDVYYVFLSGLSQERSHVFFYNDLFGRDGFYVDYTGQYSEHTSGPIRDYYYFDDNDVLTLLARCQTHGGIPSYQIDLDGDGTDELVSSRQMFFERDGLVYEAKLDEMLTFACPELDYWDYESWDPYGRFLYANGLTDWDDETGAAMWERYLYFDGENILAYKTVKPTTKDHMVEGIDDGVPPEVVEQAKAQVEKFLVQQPDGTWVHAGLGPEEELNYVMDDWRIESFHGPYTYTFGDTTVEGWGYNYEKHTTQPEKVGWAGGMYVTEDGWVSPGYPGCDYVFFQRETDGSLTFLWPGFYQESMESTYVRGSVLQNMETLGMDVSPTSYAALEFQLFLESAVHDEVLLTLDSPNGGAPQYTVSSDKNNGPYYINQLKNTDEVVWSRVETPEKEPDGASITLSDPHWYRMIRVWEDNLVLTKTSNQEPQCYRAVYRGDSSQDVYAYRTLPYYQLRSWYDEVDYDALKTRLLSSDPRLAQGFTDDFKLYDWSRAWATQYEAAHGRVDPDSCRAFSWQKVIEVEVTDQTEDSMRIWYTLAFTPANEEAFRSCWAGNTDEFSNFPYPDPEWGVPEGALYYSRVLYMAKGDGGWYIEDAGTG